MSNMHGPFDFDAPEVDEQLEQLEQLAPLAGHRPDARAYTSLQALYEPARRREEQALARVYQRLARQSSPDLSPTHEAGSWPSSLAEQTTRPLPRQPARAKKRVWLRTLAAVLIIALLFGGFLGLLNWRAQGTKPLEATPTPQKILPWHTVPVPRIAATSASLNALTVLSRQDAWAVGGTGQASTGSPLILHWDGITWKNVPAAPAVPHGSLVALASLSSDNVWAVGNVYESHQALIEHWNGHQWNVVSNPVLNAEWAALSGIAALAPDNIWAVGEYFSKSDRTQHALVIHWDGTRWQAVSTPTVGALQVLFKITAISATDIWAVGFSSRSSPMLSFERALIEHWNGQSWQIVASPDPLSSASQGIYSILTDVSASSPTDVWAVGSIRDNAGHPGRTLIEHWNGHQWSIVSSPNPFVSVDDSLNTVKALAPDDVWAATMAGGPLLHWNGHQWQYVASASLPASSGSPIVTSFAPDPSTPGTLWLAGYSIRSGSLTTPLIETNQP